MSTNIPLSTGEKTSIIGNLATMLTAGISILDAINAMEEDARGRVRTILAFVRDDLQQGKHLWESFSKFPRAFDTVTVNLLRAAEEGGTLTTSLADVRDYIRRDAEFVDKVKFALLYPVIILLVFAGVFLMILIVVIPKISLVFSRLRIPLPLPTKILLFLSNLLLHQTLWVVGGIGAIGVILMLLLRYQRPMLINLLFSLPLVSRLTTEIDLARASRSLALLLNSGVPITGALELTTGVVFKKRTKRLIMRTREMVLTGKRLSEGLRTDRVYLPGLVTAIVEAGERSGTLDKAMAEVTNALDYRVTNTLKALTTVLEPILLVVVGVSVGGIMLSIISPIYGLIGKVGAR